MCVLAEYVKKETAEGERTSACFLHKCKSYISLVTGFLHRNLLILWQLNVLIFFSKQHINGQSISPYCLQAYITGKSLHFTCFGTNESENGCTGEATNRRLPKSDFSKEQHNREASQWRPLCSQIRAKMRCKNILSNLNTALFCSLTDHYEPLVGTVADIKIINKKIFNFYCCLWLRSLWI